MGSMSSVEVRWFLRESDPRAAQIKKWLVEIVMKDLDQAAREPDKRDDSYLSVGLPMVGIKKREHGPLEVRTRTASERVRQGGFAGQLEKWGKLNGGDVAVDPKLAWTKTHKESWIAKINAKTSRFVSKTTPVSAGCGIEFTELSGDCRGTSVALEAFSDDEKTTRAIFDDALNRLANGVSGVTLAESESQGYPEWLLANSKR